jgi:hypothetical protein
MKESRSESVPWDLKELFMHHESFHWHLFEDEND